MKDSTDVEIDTMRQIWEKLAPLLPESRDRIVQWLWSKVEEVNRTPFERVRQARVDKEKFQIAIYRRDLDIARLEAKNPEIVTNGGGK